MNRILAEFVGERAPDTPLTKREIREADRIAGRALHNIRNGNLAFTVKGGRFGRHNTVHDPQVYDLVAKRLLATMDEVEISVVHISGVTGNPGSDRPVKVGYSDAITVKKMGGFTKYPSPNPGENPEAFTEGGMGFGTIPVAGPFDIELRYPHPRQVEPQSAPA